MTKIIDMRSEKIPVFYSSDMSSGGIDIGQTDDHHLVYCKLFIYDCFQNEKCLFKGLGKVIVPEKHGEDAQYLIDSANVNEDVESDKEPCLRQVNSIYGGQLKKRFGRVQQSAVVDDVETHQLREINDDCTSEMMIPRAIKVSDCLLHENVDPNVGLSIIKFDEKPKKKGDDEILTIGSDDSGNWDIINNVISDDNEAAVGAPKNIFDDYIGDENYIEPMDLEQVKVVSMENVDTIKEMPNKLDYEMLLPHSVVESNSYGHYQQSQSNENLDLDYENLYDNFFETHDELHDHTANDDGDKKHHFDDFLYAEPNNVDNMDEYFITDISNYTQSVKREKVYQSSKGTDVVCDICNRKCRSINALNHHMLVHSEDRPFVCEICKKAFKEQPTLRRHMWTHMDKQHQCDICKKYFVEKSSLRRHISTIHADFKPGTKVNQLNQKQQYSCNRCGKVFKSHAKFNIHHEMHGNPNFECDVCGKVYAGRSHLKIHQRIHTGEKPYVCNICNMKFAFKHVLKSHQARIHQKIHKFKCNVCSITFVKKSDLSSHASCHMFNMKKGKRHFSARKTMKKYSLPEVKRGPVQKSVMKLNCETRNSPVTGLFAQLIDALPERADKVDDCLLEELDVEERSDFMEGKDGLCRSPKSIEQGKKNKECLECCKAFERMGDLKRHIISHIVENIIKQAREQNHAIPEYKCEICYNMVFKQVDKFKKHLREHAKLTLYQCDVCDRAFGDSSNFSKHKKVHGISFLKCIICNRKFNTKRMMVMHMDYHKHNKPKSCGFCKKLFHFESNLRKHIKIAHLAKGNMTYRCEECGERFNSVKLKWEHQWEVHRMRKVDADCHLCSAQFRKVSLLRAHLVKEHTNVNGAYQF